MEKTSLLKVGDIIRLEPGHTVYTSRGRGVTRTITKQTAGNYIVEDTKSDGGGYGHGPHDYYPNGHHVFCVSVDGKRRVDFYQTGCFTAMIRDIKPVGKAKKTVTWKITKKPAAK